MRPVTLYLFLPAVLSVVLAACVSSPPTADAPDAYLAREFQTPAAGATITLLPPQESQYDQLRSGAETAHKLVQQQLLAAGYRVAIMNRVFYTRQWQHETEVVGGVYTDDNSGFKGKEYLQALDSLLRKSCSDTECALILDVRLVIRPAVINNGRIEWDGRQQMLAEPTEGSTAYGMSIEISAITPKGELAFKRYGGVDVPQHYRISNAQKVERPTLVAHEAAIASGVRIALQPLLVKNTKAMNVKPSGLTEAKLSSPKVSNHSVAATAAPTASTDPAAPALPAPALKLKE